MSNARHCLHVELERLIKYDINTQNTTPRQNKYLLNFQDDFGNATFKEINLNFVSHFFMSVYL